MKKKKFWKRLGIFILDFFEVFTPAITFSLLFIAFMVQVFFRYFLVPLTWPLEFTLIAFIWTTLFGACFAMRDSSHVKFSLIYDMSKPKTKIWMRIIGNVLLIFSFCIALFPTYRYIDFMSFKRSNVLKIPMNIAFSPYIVFMIIMIGRIGYNLFIDLKKFYRGEL